jgi:PKD repeat protein
MREDVRARDGIRVSPPLRRLGLGFAVLAIAVGMLAAGVSVTPGSGSVSYAVPKIAATVPPRSTDRVAPAVSPSADPSANCSALAAGWEFLDDGRPAPAVAPSLESPCRLDPDSSGLYFVSTAADSGARVEFSLTLPANGTNPAGAYSAVWFGMWLSGIGCSYGGASYLTVELIPPYADDGGVAGVPWWTVQAPVWDLVPAGSCDPQCQNSTAFFTISGRSFCEDDSVLVGPGALSANGTGALEPGDSLTLALVGAAGGASPLAVFLNDSTNPSRSLAWNYSGYAPATDGGTTLATVTGAPLVPFYAASGPGDGGWTGGLNVGYGWFNCPATPGASSFPSACNSYDGSVSASASPQIDHVVAWNATAHAYNRLYTSVEGASSSGGCSGGPAVAGCSDFTSYGGSGDYPLFGVTAAAGSAWISESPGGTGALADLGNATREFPTNASPSAPMNPIAVTGIGRTVGSTTVSVTARVTDPWSIGRVYVDAWWCASGAPRSLFVEPALLSSDPYNTALDGNWTGQVPIGGEEGTMYYTVTATGSGGGTVSAPEQQVLLSAAGTSCGVTPPPAAVFNATDVAPIAGGYALDWSQNSSAGVASYTVSAVPAGGGAVSTYPVGDVTSTRISGLVGNTSYNLVVSTTDFQNLTTNSPIVHAGPALFPLHIRPVNVTDSSPWAGLATIGVFDNVSGGDPPFTFHISFGDGVSDSVFTLSGDASAVYTFPANYSGTAAIEVSVNDSAGDSGDASAVYVSVQGPPLGVPATMSGGSGFVQLRWTAPVSPAPLSGYTIYWTTDPVWAPYLTSAWPSGRGPSGISTVLASGSPCTIPVADGTEVFAQIVAWNLHGEGLLPAEPTLGEPPYLSAVASTLTGSIAVQSDGGPAPFSDAFNATLVLAPGDQLTSAVYRFSVGPAVTPTVQSEGTTFWVNGSATFSTPGLVNVYLYVTDALGQATILPTTVYVAPGPAPILSVTVGASPLWANTSFQLTAHASGGSGSYAYNWSLGDGSTATGPVVNYSYAAPGAYVVTLSATDAIWGGSATTSTLLVAHSTPTVAVATQATSATGTYSFTAIPTGGLGTFNFTWLFGDGGSATGVSVTHAFAAAGTYTVTVQAKDQYGQVTTDSISVVVPSSSAGGGSSGGSGGTDELIGALVIVVVALAVLVGILAIRSTRARREAAGRPPPGGEGIDPSPDELRPGSPPEGGSPDG